jgi:hypothetical protein
MDKFKTAKKNDPASDVVETRLFLKRLKRDGLDEIRLHEIFEEGLRFVEKVGGFKPFNPELPAV